MLIRPAQPGDLDALMQLCAEHAEFERLTPPGPEASQTLSVALWGPEPRAMVLVVADQDHICGYASFALEFATWTGREYVHLDCLYLRESHRGHGWGRALIDKVIDAAAGLGVNEMQWQTPDWNADAIRFYERVGATPRTKVRFTLGV
jgi:GNAT superfamily N-acetyltransferase